MKLLKAIAVLLASAAFSSSAAQSICNMAYNVRVAPDALRSTAIALRWADTCRVEVEVPALGADSSDYGFDAAYSYTSGDSTLLQGSFSEHYAARNSGMSLRIVSRNGRSYAEAGAGRRLISLPVAFDPADAGSIVFENKDGLTVLAHTLLHDTIPAPAKVAFDTTEALIAAIEASHDPAAALWSYLDRDTDQNKAMPGGYYRLATLPDANGGYTVVYLGGATTNSHHWRPLQVKGRLIKTIYHNHYDVEWLDSAGRPVAAEAYARLDPATRILTVSFPLLNSTLRFRAM